MASTASGTVTTNLAGTQLTFTDTGSYGTVSSRTLTISNANGVVLVTANMGSQLTYVYNITADAYLTFVLTVIDNLGTVTATVNYVAFGYYSAAYLNKIAVSNCGCGDFENLEIAELFFTASQRFALAGLGVPSNSNIVAANVYINM